MCKNLGGSLTQGGVRRSGVNDNADFKIFNIFFLNNRGGFIELSTYSLFQYRGELMIQIFVRRG